MSASLFAPVCSITTTKRRRWFWAIWLGGPPLVVPFRKPDASDGGAATYEDALAAATARAGATLVVLDPLWARAWVRMLRGEEPWPSRRSREPQNTRTASGVEPGSIWELLGVTRETNAVELKAAYRKRVVETHPDQGGDAQTVRKVIAAYDEARRRLRRPRAKG